MKAWKADVSLLRLGDNRPFRSPRGDCTGREANVRANLLAIHRVSFGTLHATSTLFHHAL